MTSIKIVVTSIIFLIFINFFIELETQDEQIEMISTLQVKIAESTASYLVPNILDDNTDYENIIDSLYELVDNFHIWKIDGKKGELYNISHLDEDNGQFYNVEVADINYSNSKNNTVNQYDDINAYKYQYNHFLSYEEYDCIKYVIESKISYSDYDGNDTISVYIPIFDDSYNVVAVFKNQYTEVIDKFIYMRNTILNYSVFIMVIMSGVLIAISCYYLEKIKVIDRSMRKQGFYITERNGVSNISKLSTVFSDMSKRLLVNKKEIHDVVNSYESFIPYEIIQIFNRNNILELNVGEKKEMEEVILILRSNNFLDLIVNSDQNEVFDYMNTVFNNLDDNITGGFLIYFSKVDGVIIFKNSIDHTLAVAGNILKKINSNSKTFNTHKVEFQCIVTKSKMDFGIVGSNERSEMMMFLNEHHICKELFEISTKFKTGILFSDKNLLLHKDNVRCIGKVKDNTQYIYENYSNKDTAQIELLNLTKDTFHDSLLDFFDNNIENAYSGFIDVIRKNNDDLVAYNYFEICNNLTRK